MWAAPRSVRKGDRPFRCAFHAGKGCSDGHPQGAGSPACFRHRVQQAGMGKAHAGAGEAQAQTGPPCKSRKSPPTEPGAKKEVKAEKPRRGRPPKAEKRPRSRASRPKLARPMRPPRKKAAPPAPEVPPTPRDATRGEKEEIVYLDLSDLHPFKDHPFGVRDDAEMKSLVESVRNGGVNQPALVRPREGGGYEIIAGHRRQMASQLAGYRNMPCIVRNMTDDEAILAMTDDNLRQRETILPSEKAMSLKMQYEAIKHQGARGDSAEAGKLSLESVGQRNGMSVKTVQRYIWLNDLVPELKQTMDDGKLSFTPAVEISRVRPKHQKYIAVSIEGQQASPSKGQAKRLRELDKENKLSPDVIDGILCEEKKKEDRDVIITGAELEKFFWQGGHAPADERPDHDAAGGLERAAAARACQARQENGYGKVTTSGHHDQRLLLPR